MGVGVVGLVVTLLASLAVLGVDDAPQALPRVSAPPDVPSIQSTVDSSRTGDRLVVEYRTSTPVDDCAAQAAEVPKVWALVRSCTRGREPSSSGCRTSTRRR
jgi:hypothetical protein